MYDPSLGDLLLDVRNFGGGGTTQFDAFDVGQVPAGIVNRVFTADTNGVNDATGNLGTGGPLGLVTQFTLSAAPPPPAVPEPTSLALFGLGGAGLAFWRRRRTQA